MSWVVTAMAGSALMGGINAKRRGDKQDAYNRGQAEATRYGFATGNTGHPDNSYTPSMAEGAFSGAVQGAGMANSIKNAFGSQLSNVAPDGGNMLGGQDMAAQMGQDAQMPGMQQSPWTQMLRPSIYGSK